MKQRYNYEQQLVFVLLYYYIFAILFSILCLTRERKLKKYYLPKQQVRQITVMGWVRTFRNNQFIALNDGSTNNNLQVVAPLVYWMMIH